MFFDELKLPFFKALDSSDSAPLEAVYSRILLGFRFFRFRSFFRVSNSSNSRLIPVAQNAPRFFVLSLFFLCSFCVLRLVSLSLSALKNRHFPDILSLLFRCLYSVSVHAPDVASRPFLAYPIFLIRRLIIREQMRKFAYFFLCSFSAFASRLYFVSVSSLSLSAPEMIGFVSFSVFFF
jgi:hypothetical protein